MCIHENRMQTGTFAELFFAALDSKFFSVQSGCIISSTKSSPISKGGSSRTTAENHAQTVLLMLTHGPYLLVCFVVMRRAASYVYEHACNKS
jgi:hypothetical protein